MENKKTNPVKPQIEASWLEVLKMEFKKDYFIEIKQFLRQEKQKGKIIFPPGKFIFNAFNSTPFDKVKVVILGQDPYHGPGQAHGLSFSVPNGVKPPPSLVNIYKEIYNNFGHPVSKEGNLEYWAQQGVFLLNAILTVEARNAASHQKIGWQTFTDAVIKTLSDKRSGLIFLLWGKFAEGKKELIDNDKHHVLISPHPSPFSASKGFFGSNHFIRANELLKNSGQKAIDWKQSPE